MSFIRKMLNNEKGATAVEYGLMVGLMAVVIIAARVGGLEPARTCARRATVWCPYNGTRPSGIVRCGFATRYSVICFAFASNFSGTSDWADASHRKTKMTTFAAMIA